MAQMMQMIVSTIAREKGPIDGIGFMDTIGLTQEVSKDVRYLIAILQCPRRELLIA